MVVVDAVDVAAAAEAVVVHVAEDVDEETGQHLQRLFLPRPRDLTKRRKHRIILHRRRVVRRFRITARPDHSAIPFVTWWSFAFTDYDESAICCHCCAIEAFIARR